MCMRAEIPLPLPSTRRGGPRNRFYIGKAPRPTWARPLPRNHPGVRPAGRGTRRSGPGARQGGHRPPRRRGMTPLAVALGGPGPLGGRWRIRTSGSIVRPYGLATRCLRPLGQPTRRAVRSLELHGQVDKNRPCRGTIPRDHGRLEEGLGFEPRGPCGPTVFETVAFSQTRPTLHARQVRPLADPAHEPKSRQQESNPRPAPYEGAALPTELCRHRRAPRDLNPEPSG